MQHHQQQPSNGGRGTAATFRLILLFLLISISPGLFATGAGIDRTITGTVTDASGPLIGVNVIVKGTEGAGLVGTVTDLDGSYSITVPDGRDTLIFSYTGYKTREVPINGRSLIDLELSSDDQVLEEVVVVGYTTRKKGELTGSVASLDGEVLERTPNRDLAKSLSGRIPGLIVSDRGGYPGSTNDVSILIRGKSTLNNNSPLILIDNIPAASFSHLSPQDIESISVLKDGAAAIYGARAANGVILVTTKRGVTGAPRINVSSNVSLSTFSNAPDLMTSGQYAIYQNEVAARNGTVAPFTEDQIRGYTSGSDPVRFPSTDWADLTFADYAPEYRNSVSLSGGSENVKYFVSGDQLKQTGLYESRDLGFEQYQLRSNVDITVHPKVNLGVDVSGQFGNRTEPGVDDAFIYKHIYVNEPTEVGIYPNGLIGWGGENGANPAIMSSSASGFVDRVSSNLRSRLSYDIDLDGLTEGLSVQGFAGIRRWVTNTKAWYTPWEVFTFQEGTNEYISQPGFSQQGAERSLSETSWQFDEVMLNSTLRYNRSFGSHSVGGFIGMEQFTSEERSFRAERRGFPSDNHPELFAGSDEGQISTGGSREWARLNYFGSLSYDFDKKYFIDLTLRHDGSSNFGPGKRFGTFPGVAAAWALNREGFLAATSGWLDALKLRGSWALLGNDQIPPFQFLTRYDYGGPTNTARPNYYFFGTEGVRYNGYTSANVPNPDITWETAEMRNVGLNFALFDYKFTGDVNYFYQKREDILITRNASIPDVAGLTLPQENLGKVDNFGWEFQLGWKDRVGAVDFQLGSNLTLARNKVVFLDEAADVPDQLRREGFPMDSYIVYPTRGIFRDDAQVAATEVKLEGTVPGEPIYVDTNGDGTISDADRIRLYASNVPEIQYGVNGGLQYKGLDFNFLFQGQAKAQILVFFDQSGSRPAYLFTDRWTPENPNAPFPRAFAQDDPYSGNRSNPDNFQGADLWLKDASFLRLKEVELGYTFPKEKIKLGNLRISARGLNLLTMFSEVYDLGLDPEAAGYNNFRQSTYPSLKSYSLGLNLNF
ncbi:TonB-linked SusC/RagA family outer membrane protein [Lewinella marina]|uniref:SusC/RagA family protein n=1 Tax=Neolewinella marina TaxID=438751 RepID=A0A2G0CDS2_9BACT|nr:TonB-dependent receptor [Neolewinella marina]NJB85959.1 TonB-linked SusC/RagA family outer membrane protein [Neolewinella marina]PHK98070.1 SusC/RagA family protein [Neolewinella marina]